MLRSNPAERSRYVAQRDKPPGVEPNQRVRIEILCLRQPPTRQTADMLGVLRVYSRWHGGPREQGPPTRTWARNQHHDDAERNQCPSKKPKLLLAGFWIVLR